MTGGQEQRGLPDRRAQPLRRLHSDEAYLPERVRHKRVAEAICAACPVRRPCAVHALVHREPHGVWGGLSAADRRDRLAQP